MCWWWSIKLLFFFPQVALATFAIYVLTGNELTANKAFVALALFNILRYPITFLPNVIVSTIQVSIRLYKWTHVSLDIFSHWQIAKTFGVILIQVPSARLQQPKSFLSYIGFFSPPFQGQVSINRLTDFLNLPELDPNNVEKTMPEHSEFRMSFTLFLLLLTVILGK